MLLIVIGLFQSAYAAPKQTVLVMGDSLSSGFGISPTESWVGLLSMRVGTAEYGYRVVNASITGDTTTGGLKRLPRALKLHAPAIVIIELGGNDGLRGTPLTLVRSNLAQMIQLSQGAGATVILVGMQIPFNYGAPYTRAFANLYPALAQEYTSGLVGFFLEGMALDIKMFQPDGIHPTAAAQPVLLNNVWPPLKQAMKDRAAAEGKAKTPT